MKILRWVTLSFVFELLMFSLLAGCGESREALLAKAASALQSNDIDTARRIYQRILHTQPMDPEAIQGMVASTRLSDATEEQGRWCRELLRFRPWDRYANIVVARELMAEGNLKDAVVRLILAYQDSIYKQDKREVLDLLEQIRILEQARTQPLKEAH